MKKRFNEIILFCAVAASLVFAGRVHAEDDGGGRSVFATGAGIRALGLGGAYGAVANDASAVLWNPGGLGWVERSEFQASHTSYYGLGIDEQYGSFVIPSWRWGAASITFRHFGVGGIERRDDRNILLEGGLSDNETELSIGYGRRVGNAWSIGGAIKLQHQGLAGFGDSGLGLDVGLIVRPLAALNISTSAADRFSLALAVRNVLKPSIRLTDDRVTDPTGVRFGTSYWLPIWSGRSLLAAFDVEKTDGMNARVHAGVELNVHPLLCLRTGINDGTFTAGTGIRWRGMSFEYTIEDNPIDNVHRFGATFTFGAAVDESRLAAVEAQENALQSKLAQAFEEQQRERVRQLLAEADRAKREGEFDEALELITVVTALDPDHEDALRQKGICLRGLGEKLEGQGDFAAAMLSYSRALAVLPRDSAAITGLERCRDESDRLAARSETIRQRFAAALDAFSAHDLTRARDQFAAILRLAPDDQEAAAMHERTLQAIDQRTTDLLEQAERMIEWGHLDEAQSLLDGVEKLGPNARDFRRIKAQLSEVKRQQRATGISTQGGDGRTQGSISSGGSGTRPITDEQKREIRHLYQQGMKAMEDGRAHEAVKYWELVWAVDPNHERVADHLKREYLRRGMEYFADGKLDQAVELWESALRVDPADKRTMGYLSRAREQMARTREILGK
ncbi:MAG: PorV/PorQ family protein [Candidatus Latescibacteria bacterium]|nr:PorV/PorQ family protein [Candidatus Latescibacterota bacterium]NIO56752.1 PorV/PorQ family protein [Candidatus Latescibacterota bacterium]NIT02337.1 PorV/PorQ family protein [Candidatus Latescibacterota bacterium]NIT39220.1 PorV/PorQ family protein [Candidatus Latescibacterota bacterium]